MVDIVDEVGCFVFIVIYNIVFIFSGFGCIVVIDNGDFIDFMLFVLYQCNVFSGKVLVIIQSENYYSGDIVFIVINKELGIMLLWIWLKQFVYEIQVVIMIGFYKWVFYGLFILFVISIVLVLIVFDQMFFSSLLMFW